MYQLSYYQQWQFARDIVLEQNLNMTEKNKASMRQSLICEPSNLQVEIRFLHLKVKKKV